MLFFSRDSMWLYDLFNSSKKVGNLSSFYFGLFEITHLRNQQSINKNLFNKKSPKTYDNKLRLLEKEFFSKKENHKLIHSQHLLNHQFQKR